jgi:ribosomal protein L37AE/L43A
VTEFTQQEVDSRIQGLDPDAAKRVVCALIGHSNIQSQWIGYWYCGRCGDQVGDSLGGAYSSAEIVLIGHNCATCQKNFSKLTWKDTFLAPAPFKAESESAA